MEQDKITAHGDELYDALIKRSPVGRLGTALKAGEVILSGSQTPLVPVVEGDNLTCSVGGIGSTSVRFTQRSVQ